MKRKLSAEDFVETLYKTFFDRKSEEFTKICKQYGIDRGTI